MYTTLTSFLVVRICFKQGTLWTKFLH